MKEVFIGMCVAFLFMYLIVNSINASFGYSDAINLPSYKINKCKLPLTRGDILFPGYKFGCWLSEPVFKEKE